MRLRPTAAPLLFAALAVPLFAAPARAERVYLRDGDVIEGWILEESPTQLVLQVIRGSSVGKITIAQADVELVDRRRTESLEDALARARRSRPGPEPAPPAAPPPGVTPPAAPPPGAPAPKKEAPKKTAADLIPKATPEQEEEIQAQLAKLGGESHHRGRAGREGAAAETLAAMGPVVIPYMALALDDANGATRRGAAKVLASVAHTETHLEAYVDAIPGLLRLLQDASPYARADGAEALDAIAGAGIAWPAAGDAPEITPEEAAATLKYQQWWEAAKKKLGEGSGEKK
jgi:hypothetical protein